MSAAEGKLVQIILDTRDDLPVTLETLTSTERWLNGVGEGLVRHTEQEGVGGLGALGMAAGLAAALAVCRDMRAVLTPTPDTPENLARPGQNPTL